MLRPGISFKKLLSEPILNTLSVSAICRFSPALLGVDAVNARHVTLANTPARILDCEDTVTTPFKLKKRDRRIKFVLHSY
jgi:hypothetical protein